MTPVARAASFDTAAFQPAQTRGRPVEDFTNHGDTKARKTRAKGLQKLTRVPFKVSRLMEFCTERELVNQTGHKADEWPLVVLKELVDNALDECEEAGIAPAITVEVAGDDVTIADNGRGIPASTIKSVLDYNIRVSSREAYVSPTRRLRKR